MSKVTARHLADFLGTECATIRSIASRARRAGIELRVNDPRHHVALYDEDLFIDYVIDRPGRGDVATMRERAVARRREAREAEAAMLRRVMRR